MISFNERKFFKMSEGIEQLSNQPNSSQEDLLYLKNLAERDKLIKDN